MLINEKTDFDQENNDGDTLLMIALENKYSDKLLKIFINKKTYFNQKELMPLKFFRKFHENIINLLFKKRKKKKIKEKINENGYYNYKYGQRY